MSKGRWLKLTGLCVSLLGGAAWSGPAVSPTVAPPSGLPILKRDLSEYVAKHPTEFLKLASKSSNWQTSSGTPETAVSIPDEVLTGASGCALSTPVTITPAQNTHLLKHFKKGQTAPSDMDDATAAHGVIVARIINPTNCTAAPVNFAPGTYYWIVRGVGSGASRTYESVFVHAEDLSDTVKVRFDRCANADHPQPDDSADSFLLTDVCTDAITQSVPRDAQARARYTEKVRALVARGRGVKGARKGRFDGDDIALWIACDQGCCYASGF